MRDYSKVSPQFWIGSTGKKLRSKGVDCQLVSLYLLTCSHANMLGMYYLPKIYIAHECGLTLEGASKGLNSAIEAGFCAYDEASEVVWVYEMATYQIGEQLSEKDLRVKGVQNEYNAQPNSPYLAPFFEKYSAKFLMINMRKIEAPSKPLASQEQEQEQEQEKEQEQEHAQEQENTAQKNAVDVRKKEAAPFSEIDPEILKQWIAVRKKKRGADLSNLVYKAMIRESELCSITLQRAIEICVERNWVAFHADYYRPTNKGFMTKAQHMAANSKKAGDDFVNGTNEREVKGEIVND